MNDTISKELYEKLRIQISIYSGKLDGGLASLQDMYHKMNNKEKVICECCGNVINGDGGHDKNCKIVLKYNQVFDV
jgi:hypothetical protein